MFINIIFYFFLSSLLIAALPGPAMMLTIQAAIQGGWRKGGMVTVGILAADALLLGAVCLGLGSLMASSPKLLFAMNVCASLYLLYLGAQSLYSIRSMGGSLPETQSGGWQQGFLITVINAKTIVFLLAYLPQFVVSGSAWPEQVQLAVLSLVFLLAVAAVMSAYTFAAHAARDFLSAARVRKLMAFCFGILLIYIGLSSLYQAV